MSIRARVDDALFLWQHGRQQGAFLCALVAVAATSRRRFPDRKTFRDRQAFVSFLTGTLQVRLSVEYRGECLPVEEILYEWVRCQLVHEGTLPIDIEFMADPEPGVLALRAGGAPEFVLKVSEGWFRHLIGSVMTAAENSDQFSQE